MTPLEGVLTITGEGPVRTVTLNRPEAGNAANSELHTALAHVWEELARDSDIRVVVLTGAGRMFSSGGDLTWFSSLSHDAEERARVLAEGRRIVYGMLDFTGAIVAAVNGPAVGLGATLVSLCDIVVMASSAFVADPHVSVGLVAGDGSAMTWPLIMGMQRAKGKLLTGDRISADEALAVGLATQVVDVDQVLPAAVAFAQRLAAQPRMALEGTRRVLNAPLRKAVDATIDLAFDLEDLTFQDPEHIEKVQQVLRDRDGRSDRRPS